MRKVLLVIGLILLISCVSATEVGGGFYFSVPSTIPAYYNFNLGSGYYIYSYSIKSNGIINSSHFTLRGSNDEFSWNNLDSESEIFSSGEELNFIINSMISYQYIQFSMDSGFNETGTSMSIHLFSSSIPSSSSGLISIASKGENFIKWSFDTYNISRLVLDGSEIPLDADYYIQSNLLPNSTHRLTAYLNNGSAFYTETTTSESFNNKILSFIWEWKFTFLSLILCILSFWSPIFALLAIIITGIDGKYSWHVYSMIHIVVDGFLLCIEIFLFGWEL